MSNEIYRPEKQPTSTTKKVLMWAGAVLTTIALSVGGFLIARHLSAPAPTVPNEPERIVEDDLPEEIDKLLENVTPFGEEIQKGKQGRTILGRDAETAYPFEAAITVDKVQEANPLTVTGSPQEEPLLGDYGARFWYITATITVDEKPADDTYIYFPLFLSNEQTPLDDPDRVVLSKENPDCLWGPNTWGEVKGNTVTKCRIAVTLDDEPIDKILMTYAIDFADYPEAASNPPSFVFEALPIKEG